MDYGGGIFREGQSCNLFRCEPLGVAGIVAGAKFAGDDLAEKINEHIVVRSALILIGHDAFEDSEQFGGAHSKTGFFAGLALGSLTQSFAEFQHATGNRPFAEQRRLASLDQGYMAVRNDDRADTD